MRSEHKTLIRDVLVVVVAFVIAGALGGWLWHHLWAPAPEGVVVEHVAHFDDDADFRGTGLYLPIAAGIGLLLGLVITWVFERDEVVTLLAVAVGSLLGGLVMLWVGHTLGPESASEFAEGAKDWETVTGDLHAAWLPVLLSCPGGAARFGHRSLMFHKQA